MKNSYKRKLRSSSACVFAAMVAFAGPALAADEFPAGEACDFPLEVEPGPGHGSTIFRTFTDKDGNVVRVLIAGTSPSLAFTNVENDKTFAVSSKGQAIHITNHPDGSSTLVATGQTAIIYSPADDPGPAAFLYVGRVKVEIDALGIFDLDSVHGRAIDLCALLSD